MLASSLSSAGEGRLTGALRGRLDSGARRCRPRFGRGRRRASGAEVGSDCADRAGRAAPPGRPAAAALRALAVPGDTTPVVDCRAQDRFDGCDGSQVGRRARGGQRRIRHDLGRRRAASACRGGTGQRAHSTCDRQTASRRPGQSTPEAGGTPACPASSAPARRGASDDAGASSRTSRTSPTSRTFSTSRTSSTSSTSRTTTAGRYAYAAARSAPAGQARTSTCARGRHGRRRRRRRDRRR